ncbi:MAG: molecular chaperone HtpG [Xanthomonadaceae bacterium]|nr:molecular chaperone HtpG [Xanthomonadaceae bacterium]
MTTETFSFQAEVQQVLKLVIHSLYSHKEIFLRELVSNASDACDKLRFEALQNADLYGDQPGLNIYLSADKEARTLSIRDSGIGMSRHELIENLGTVARSGTRKFLEALSEDKRGDAQLIGQFGVGFYAAFIVADKVSVTSRRAGSDEAWTWTSAEGGNTFEVSSAAADSPRGTTVTLHLRDDESEFLDDWRLRSLVHRYSEHIGFPIHMRAEKKGDDESDDAKAGSNEWETVNQASALWTKPRNELSDADYQAFYQHVSHDFGEALAWTHNRVEGNQNFTSLLYLPAKAPFDMFSGRDERKGLKLYIKRVFIMDASEQMLPNYLRFVRGVVDSDDLPLNVSRELLQSSRQVERIRGALTKRTLDLLDRLANEDKEKYDSFWQQFGNVLKEGVVEDNGNRERILKLARFPSSLSQSADDRVSLDAYIARMQPEQKAIYYVTADGWNAARRSPQIEALTQRGIEVLLLHERVDEWMAGYLHEYDGKPLRNVAKGELDADLPSAEADKGKAEQADKDAAPLIERLKHLLGDKVSGVKVSRRLVDSPACLVTGEHDMAPHMQRLLAAAGHAMPQSAPTLEINPGHPLLQRLANEADTAKADDLGWLLLEQAQLTAGAALDDAAGFVARMNRLIGA